MFTQGLFKGYFRGALINFAQFFGVQYHALLWSQGTGYFNHFLVSSLIETALYPFDTIKTLLYSDIQGAYKGMADCAGDIISKGGVANLWSGFFAKLS
jgi:hypothetical protein